MVLYHKWGVKTGLIFALKFFMLISDGLGGVMWIMEQFGPSLNTYSAVLRAHQDLCGDNLCHLENLDRPANLAHKTGDHVKTVKPFAFLPLKGF